MEERRRGRRRERCGTKGVREITPDFCYLVIDGTRGLHLAANHFSDLLVALMGNFVFF
jgi:hypothetical protein